jgi:hypothetical protein
MSMSEHDLGHYTTNREGEIVWVGSSRGETLATARRAERAEQRLHEERLRINKCVTLLKAEPPDVAAALAALALL